MPVMAVNNQNQHERPGDYRARPRWSAGKKMEAALRLLPGEPLETLSRELGVEAHRLAAWRDDFLEVASKVSRASGWTDPPTIGRCGRPNARSAS